MLGCRCLMKLKHIGHACGGCALSYTYKLHRWTVLISVSSREVLLYFPQRKCMQFSLKYIQTTAPGIHGLAAQCSPIQLTSPHPVPTSSVPLLLIPVLFTQLALVSRSDHSPFSPLTSSSPQPSESLFSTRLFLLWYPPSLITSDTIEAHTHTCRSTCMKPLESQCRHLLIVAVSKVSVVESTSLLSCTHNVTTTTPH